VTWEFGGIGLRRFGLLGFLLVLLIVFSFASPYFLSVRNLTNILLSVSVIGIMAAVSTLVVVARGLDLSIGSTVGLVGVAVAALLQEGWPWWLAIVAGLILGALCGALNGAVIVGLRINSIITTIGTLSIIRGAAYIATGGQTLFVESEPILDLGSSRIAGIPYSVLLMLALFALCHFAADYMRIGRSLYAIGANPRASLISGLSLGRYRFWIFVASGIAAGLSGILLIGQSGTAVPTGGTGYELLVVTAVLLGGASLHGGEGRVSGTLIGVLIIGVLANGMTLVGVNSYYQTVANGVLLLAAVAIDQLRGDVRDES
jgi:ribose transport system permease protein